MQFRLPYGEGALMIELPDSYQVTLLEREAAPPLPDAPGELHDALLEPIGKAPLHALIQPEDKIGIVFNDITRPTPNSQIIHAILDELPQVPRANITLFNALGTHRPNTHPELQAMLDPGLVAQYSIVQNEAVDPAFLKYLGTTQRGHPIWLNREFLECDVKILTGFIEPHFFAGFSGGGKAIMPGMAGMETIRANHNAEMIGDPKATWGITNGNPIWEEVHEIARMLDGVFLVNVTLNKDKRITGIFCGDLEEAHRKGCEYARQTALIPVARPFDIVITSNSGYPLDLNLYQSVKGMSAAAQIVKPGGAIIIAAECRDGVPEHGLYGGLLRQHSTPDQLLGSIRGAGSVHQDQWQVQIQAMLQLKADIYVYSRGLSDEQVRSAMLRPCPSIEGKLAELIQQYGPEARIGILPEGPQTIPFLSA
jgi:nickel-dependent lactate racemase